MTTFQSIQTGFTSASQTIQDGLYKSDAGVGSLFENYSASLQANSNFLIIKAPPEVVGIEGFQFDLIEEESITQSANITEHPVENRTYVSDHISHTPLIFTIKGTMGEIFQKRDVINKAIDVATEKLGIIEQYNVPFAADTRQQIRDIQQKGNQTVDFIKKTLNDGTRLADSFVNKNQTQDLKRTQNAQQFFQFLKINNIACNINTYISGYLQNMFLKEINSIRISYDNVLNFTLTFQQINFVKTQFTGFNDNKSQVAKQNEANVAKTGAANTKQVPKESLLSEIGVGNLIRNIF
jgi:hypothetical protein